MHDTDQCPIHSTLFTSIGIIQLITSTLSAECIDSESVINVVCSSTAAYNRIGGVTRSRRIDPKYAFVCVFSILKIRLYIIAINMKDEARVESRK